VGRWFGRLPEEKSKMAINIGWINESEAEGSLAAAYEHYRHLRQRDFVPDILKCFSHRPDFFRQVLEFSDTIHFSDGHLKQRTKELIATYVSVLNRCPY
jgi:alkylhydroperoxidase family enzyme